MKQVVFISGKGGTGKSTLVSSLAILVDNKMLADCDVEAPNLHLLLENEVLKSDGFTGAQEAVIDLDLCNECGLCIDVCRFEAISDDYRIKPMKCEGCGACTLVCPQGAIVLRGVQTGETFISKTKQGPLSHALLNIGAEGSGKLVAQVRKQVKDFGGKEEWLIIDGSPGVGCVVIASITGTDAVVVVSEPTKTGQKDLERVLAVADHFDIPAFVCINKYDLNLKISSQIEQFCHANKYPVLAKLPFDPSVVEALRELKTPIEAGNYEITREVQKIWTGLLEEMSKLESKKS